MKNITGAKMAQYFTDVFGANTIAQIKYIKPRTYRGDAWVDETRFEALCQKLKAKGYKFSAQKFSRMIKFGYVPDWAEMRFQGWTMYYPESE